MGVEVEVSSHVIVLDLHSFLVSIVLDLRNVDLLEDRNSFIHSILKLKVIGELQQLLLSDIHLTWSLKTLVQSLVKELNVSRFELLIQNLFLPLLIIIGAILLTN